MDPTTPICEVARAKLNLALHIRRRRTDGYHDIESIFAFCEDGDEVTACASDRVSLDITGPFADGLTTGGDNLIRRTVDAVRAEYAAELAHRPGVALHLIKNLPVASGIGGGSADAAATLRLLARLWTLPDDPDRLMRVAATLGADVAPCLASRTLRVDGRGERFAVCDAPELTGCCVVLVNPRVPVATAAVFAGWDGVDRGGLPGDVSIAGLYSDGRNDMTPTALRIAPEISDVLKALERTRPLLARMSGSGATCFALYDSVAARDAAMAEMRPEWWTLASRLT